MCIFIFVLAGERGEEGRCNVGGVCLRVGIFYDKQYSFFFFFVHVVVVKRRCFLKFPNCNLSSQLRSSVQYIL